MISFHDMAVKASVRLLRSKFENKGLGFSDTGPGDNPDIAIYDEYSNAGHAEVKTIVDQELTEMLTLLFKDKFYREDRLDKTGQFHLTLQKHAKIKPVKKEFWKLFDDLTDDPHTQTQSIQQSLLHMGVDHVRYVKSTQGFSLVLHPPTLTFGPSEGQITSRDLLEETLKTFADKHSLRTMQDERHKLNHLFAWPDNTLYPGLAFSAEDEPYITPPDQPELPDWLDGFWIGHTYSLNKPNYRAWFFSQECGWEVVESHEIS